MKRNDYETYKAIYEREREKIGASLAIRCALVDVIQEGMINCIREGLKKGIKN